MGNRRKISEDIPPEAAYTLTVMLEDASGNVTTIRVNQSRFTLERRCCMVRALLAVHDASHGYLPDDDEFESGRLPS